MNNKINVNVLAEAKQEYTSQIKDIFTPQIYLGLKSMYNAAKEFCSKTRSNNVLKKFQTILSNTPHWKQDKLLTEFNRIELASKCDYIEDLITALFISHTKVLASIKLKSKSKSINMDVPTGTFFVHKVYIECARKFWAHPYLFHTECSNLELQRNLLQTETLIKECIMETVRKLLPVKDVLKEYLGNDYNDDDLDITSNVSISKNNNIRKMIKLEINDNVKSDKKDTFHKSIQIGGDDILEEDENISIQISNAMDVESNKYATDNNSIKSKNKNANTIKKLVNSVKEDSVKEDSVKEDSVKVNSITKETRYTNLVKREKPITSDVKYINIGGSLEKSPIDNSKESSLVSKVSTFNNSDIEKLDDNDTINHESSKSNNTSSNNSSYSKLSEDSNLINSEQEFDKKNVELEIKDKDSEIKSLLLENLDTGSEIKSIILDNSGSMQLKNYNLENNNKNFEPDDASDNMSISNLQSLEDIRNDLTKDLENKTDRFSFFEDAANF